MSMENEEIIENEEEVETLPEDEEQAQYDKEYEEAMAKLNDDEQPAQDSEDIEEEPAAEEEEEPGEEEQPGEEDSLKPGEAEEEEQEEPEMVEITWRGKPVKITKEQERQLAQQGYDYTYKTQELAKSRKEHEAELQLLEKVRKGDKEALARLAKQSGVDPIDLLDIDLEDNEQGTPEPQGEEEPFVSSQVAALLEEVQKDPELNEKMVEVQDYLPSGVIDVMAKDPETFYAVVNEVRSGDADIVLPRVNAELASLPELDRSLVMNNPDQFAQFYMTVKQSLIEAQGKQTQEKPKGRQPNPNRAAAAVSRSGRTAGREDGKPGELLSDSEYEKIRQRLESQN